MNKRILHPNGEGKNGKGMWIRHGGSKYLLDECAINKCGAMYSPVWVRPVHGFYDSPQNPPRLALYNRSGDFIGHADLAERLSHA